jgi:GGDEF domain-containing protein
MTVDLGTLGSPPSHDQLAQMLQTAERNVGKAVRLQWQAGEEGCKFFLQGQIKAKSTNSIPEWTLRRLFEQDLSSLESHMRSDANLFQMVTGDIGLLFNLIWSECNGTNQEVDQNRQSKAFDTLNNPQLKDIRLEYNPAAFGSSPFRSAPAPRMFDGGGSARPVFQQQGTSQTQAATQNSAAASVVLSGELSEVDLTGVLQSIKICDMVGRLDIRDRLSQVELFFEGAEVVHAVYTNALTGDAHQSTVGDRVILDVLTWDRGTFVFNKALKTSERSVKRRLQGLLLEGASLRDYRQYVQEAGVNEDTVLEHTQELSAEEAQRVLEDGVNVDIAKQLTIYAAIDAKTTLGEIVQQLSMSKSVWLPIAFNLLNCQLAAPVDKNKSSSSGAGRSRVTIRPKAIVVAAGQLLRPDTGIYSFPLFMHFLQLEWARFTKQKSMFSIVLFEFKNNTEPVSQTALQQMVQCFDSIKDEFHILGHFGDLDFAILIPLQSSGESKILLESFAAKLTQTKLHGFQKMQDLHLVFGVADTVDGRSTVSELMEEADDARLAAVKQKVTIKTTAECRWERLRDKAGAMRGADHEALKAIWSEALFEARRIGGNGAQRDVTLEALADVLLNLKAYSEAEPCLLELLTLKKHLLGAGDKAVLKAGNALVKCYSEQNKLDEAERLQHQIVRGYVREIGNDHPEAPDAAYFLVDFYRGLGDYQRASEACKTVLDMTTAIFGATDPKTVRVKIDYDELRQLEV